MEFRNRILPTLLIDDEKLVKTVRFKKPNYLGDPVNAVKIFNDKEVDEIILLDIRAGIKGKEPNYQKIEEICSEAFMPFAYGGGIRSLEQIKRLFDLGIEKVILNSSLIDNIDLVRNAANIYGEQSIVASVDVKKGLTGNYSAYAGSGRNKVNQSLSDFIQSILQAGVGEIMLNAIHREGTYKGYDLKLIQQVSDICDVPLIACGGARDLTSFLKAIESGATAVAAGSLFVYRGMEKGIMINYPSAVELEAEIFNKLNK